MSNDIPSALAALPADVRERVEQAAHTFGNEAWSTRPRRAALTVTLVSTMDPEADAWDVVAEVVGAPDFRGFGRAEHCVEAQAAALRDLADRIGGTPRPTSTTVYCLRCGAVRALVSPDGCPSCGAKHVRDSVVAR